MVILFETKIDTTATYKYYIDFASKYGIEYVILDEGWYKLGDLFDINPDIDLPGLLAHAKKKNVGIILWVVWKTLDDQFYEALDQLLADLREKGKIGVIVQSPVKGSSSVKEKRFFFLKRHWDKVDAIAKKHGMYFYNMYNIFEPDDQLFPDDMHLNHEGANMFTSQLLQRMKEDKIFQRVNMLAQKRGL